jgi:DNA helicase II / ATP-dependent DNA helicase PcrA
MKDSEREKEFQKKLKELNSEQKEAVDTIEGPVMVVAGPGTGKTQILTLRIANILLRTDTDPENILALTFTEAGVDSMRRRLVELIGPTAYRVSIHTFHGLASKIIDEYVDVFEEILESHLALDTEQIEIVEGIIDSNTFEHIVPFGSPYFYVRALLSSIHTLKRERVSPEEFRKLTEVQKEDLLGAEDLYHLKGRYEGKMKGEYQRLLLKLEKNRELSFVYEAYETKRKERKLHDYEDLINEVVSVMQGNENFLLTLQERYQYVLVDEHQDTNNSQNTFLELLSGFFEEPNLFIVGDEKQAIYKFQGASIDNFLYFKKRFPQTKVLHLVTNYRSTQEILDSAHMLIENNELAEGEVRKKLASHKGVGISVNLLLSDSPVSEIEAVVDSIDARLKEGVPAGEIAVLFRNNRDSDQIMHSLSHRGIPYSLIAPENLLADCFVRKLFILFSCIQNPQRDEVLGKALLLDFFELSLVEVYELLSTRSRGMKLHDMLLQETKKKSSLGAWYENILEWKSDSINMNFLEFVKHVFKSSGILSKIINEQSKEVLPMSNFLKEIEKYSKNYPKALLQDFLVYVDRLEEYGLALPYSRRRADGVVLSTAHGSKGREFDYVYIVHAQDGRWGNTRNRNLFHLSLSTHIRSEKGDVGDERRLFYVALTRARKEAVVSFSKKDAGGKEKIPSQFIEEIRESGLCETEASPSTHHLLSLGVEEEASEEFLAFVRQQFLSQGLSVTAINNFLECPRRYFYSNLIRLPEAYTRAASFGTAIHKALKDFNEVINQGSEVSGKILLEMYKKALLAQKESLSESDYEELEKKGKKVLEGYFETHKVGFVAGSKNEVSLKTSIVVDGIPEEVRLRGILDKIEACEGGVRVVDYKTGKPKSRGIIEGTTKDSNGNYKRQLEFYKLLLDHHEDLGLSMQEGMIDFLEPTESGAYKREKFIVTTEEVTKLTSEISEVSQKIYNGQFEGCQKKDCAYCAFATVVRSE